jgi:hypothetical protein
MAYHVEFKSKTGYGSIGGKEYCVWCYKLKVDPPLRFVDKIGLDLSKAIDIKDPADYPGVGALGGTKLERPATGKRQHVYRDVPNPPPNTNELEICFLAPCESSNGKTIVSLDKRSAETGPSWISLPFTEGAPSGLHDRTRKLEGPFVAASRLERPRRRPAARARARASKKKSRPSSRPRARRTRRR